MLRRPDRSRVPRAIWRALEHLGLQPDVLIREANLPRALATDDTLLITTAQLFSLWKAVEKLAPDPGIGIAIVEATATTGHQPALLAAYYAATFRDSLAECDRSKRMSSSELFTYEDCDGVFSMTKGWLYASEPEPPVSVDMTFAFTMALGRMGTGEHLVPVRIEYTRPGPPCAALDRYFACPIVFGAAANRLVMKSADLALPFVSRNADFLELVRPALAAAAEAVMPHRSIGEDVKAVLKTKLEHGQAEIDVVARALGMSERTLQRRIADEGLRFRELLVESRRELSRTLLTNQALPLETIASALGYKNVSSFFRAFREWEGMTPSEWRERTLDRV